MSNSDHVSVAGLSKTFPAQDGELQALDGVNLTAREGEFLSIIGPSGCGKTTLLRLIGGLLPPTSGQLTIGGLTPQAAQRRKQLSFVFQDPGLLPWRTVTDNVRLPLQVNPQPERERAARVDELVQTVGLADFARYYPHQLSGGMRQRVALARALVVEPQLLLMDEPLGALDEITRAEMRYEILRLWEASPKTVLMVTHSVADAVLLSDRILVMSGPPGRIRGSLTVNIPRPRPADLERTPLFLDYAERIHMLLTKGATRGTLPR